jgi:hypothetical protein
VNVNAILPAQSDETGGRAYLAVKAKVAKAGGFQRLPFAQGTDNKRGRLLGESISLAALAAGGESPWAANETPGHVPGAVAAAGRTQRRHGEETGGHGAEHHGGHEIRRAYDPVNDSGRRRPVSLGHDDRRRQVHRLQRVHRGVRSREQHPLGRGVRDPAQSRDELAAHRALLGVGEPTLETGRPEIQSREKLGNVDVRNSPMLCQQCGRRRASRCARCSRPITRRRA